MRILRLEFAHIGSYKEKTEIDFEQFHNDMFLICGETGAGKTIIFDAITYAFYGRASGEYRDAEMLRARSASTTDKPYVTLDFMQRGKKYTVTRTYSYEREAKRGSGTTMEGASVELITPDRKDPIKGEAAKTTLKELTGLDYDQFTKTVMIAQGGFIKLINENTAKREPLFSKLFGVDKYTVFSDKIDKLCGEEEKKLDAVREHIKENYASIKLDEQSEHYERFVTLKEQGSAALSQMRELVGALITSDSEQAEQKDKQLAELEEKLKASNLVIKSIEERRDYVKKLEAEQANNKTLAEKLMQANNSLEKAKARLPEAQKLDKESAQLESQLDVYAELDDVRNKAQQQKQQLETAAAGKAKTAAERDAAAAELESLNNEHKVLSDAALKLEVAGANINKAADEGENVKMLSKRLADVLELESNRTVKKKQRDGLEAKTADLTSEIEKRESELADYERRVKDYSDLPRQHQQLLGDKENTLKQLADISRLTADKAALDKLREQHKTAAQRFERAENEKQRARAACEQLESILRKERAGILALGLVDNEPCPVCGSLHHPNPAVTTLENGVKIPSEDEVEAAKEAAERASESADKAFRETNDLNNKAAAMENSLLASAHTLLGKECTADEVTVLVQDRTNALNNELWALEAREKELAQKIDEGRALARSIEDKKAELSGKRDVLTRTGQNLSDVTSQLGTLDGQAKTLGDELDRQLAETFGDSDRAKADSRIRERLAKIDGEMKALGETKAAEQKRLDRYNELTSLIPEKEKRISELVSTISALEKQEASAASLSAELSQRAQKLAQGLRFDSLEKAKAQLEAARLEAAKLREDAERLQKNVSSLDKAAAESEGRIKSLEETISRYEDIDPAKAEAEHGQLEAVIAASRAAKSDADARVRMNKNVLERLEEGAKELEAAEHMTAMMSELADTACGRVKTNKMTITSFALSSYFENVLARANERMIIMSDGRYNLMHSADKMGNNKIGLDIDIYDRDEETRRDVRTLSGGEGFMASLSLALGLAEEIQSCVGGIELDSMFIDEGFGTLDVSSLESVMKALDCGKEGTRSVGLISHVPDIKSAVPHIIEVTNTHTNGSKLTIK